MTEGVSCKNGSVHREKTGIKQKKKDRRKLK